MLKSLNPLFFRYLVGTNILAIVVILIPFLILNTSLSNELFYKSWLYFSFTIEMFVWLAISFGIRRMKQRKWVEAGFWVFLLWQIVSFFGPWGLNLNQNLRLFLFMTSGIGLAVSSWLVAACFNIRIKGLSGYFKILGFVMVLSALIRMALPILAVSLQLEGIIEYNGVTHVLPLFALLPITFNLQKLFRQENSGIY
ncbi:hypothetical protein [Desertivirga arenae]|uniref:hypothetical protein n=1 Tax=Desertivirga arenae TaxID=2810309 RepID=UPI001A9582DE|nr:hypothetical protein [Pedobacter sp. SYSU D00823]